MTDDVRKEIFELLNEFVEIHKAFDTIFDPYIEKINELGRKVTENTTKEDGGIRSAIVNKIEYLYLDIINKAGVFMTVGRTLFSIPFDIVAEDVEILQQKEEALSKIIASVSYAMENTLKQIRNIADFLKEHENKE